MNSLTATVTMRPLAMRDGSTAPATSTCAMIQPPKMSPLAFESAGIGMTRMTSSAPSGKLVGPVRRPAGLEGSVIVFTISIVWIQLS